MYHYKYVAQALFSDGTFKSRCFVTHNALSNFANSMYHKDENVTVNVYDFNDIDKLIETWHA